MAILAATHVATEPLCLRIEDKNRLLSTIPITTEQHFRLSFRHSLYGSTVEEQFRIAGHRFQLVGSRYSEQRLLEFYGHEDGLFQNGWWLVVRNGREIPSLELRVSPDSHFKLSHSLRRIHLSTAVAEDGLVRVRAGSCSG